MITVSLQHSFVPVGRVNDRRRRRTVLRVKAIDKKQLKSEKPKISSGIILKEKQQDENLLFTADGHWSVESTHAPAIQRGTKKVTNPFFSLFLPTGFPKTVSSDYLAYQLWTLPTHITGWVSASLATSSLLRAVGVGAGAAQTATLTAAIKWITKDGVGALGKLLVGGRLGVYFDEDPRLWRMIAESVSTIGLSLEIATVFFPNDFLLLAGGGNFAKALAKGMANPSFRVIQQHFARFNNIGEISAKEESWEVAGQTIGLLTSVGILSLLEGSSEWHLVLITWACFHTVHVICRYFALDALEFDCINTARADRLITAHLQSLEVPDPHWVSQEEKFLLDWMVIGPEVEFGASVKDLSLDFTGNEFQSWVEIFKQEAFLLHVKQGRGHVALKETHTSLDCLKAFWQFLWIKKQAQEDDPSLDQIQAALQEANKHFPDFEVKARKAGWNLENTTFRLGMIRVQEQTYKSDP